MAWSTHWHHEKSFITSGPDVACIFQATTGEKFATLIDLTYDDTDTRITNYSTAMTDAASEIQ